MNQNRNSSANSQLARLVIGMAVFVIPAAFSATSVAQCAFINPPILHQELRYSLTGGSSYADRGSAFWKNVVYLLGGFGSEIMHPVSEYYAGCYRSIGRRYTATYYSTTSGTKSGRGA
jgi:hypothetical protein